MNENTNPASQEVEIPTTDSDAAAGTAATTAPSAAEEQKPAAAPAEEPPEAAEAKPAPPPETAPAGEPKQESSEADDTSERLKALEAENAALKHGVKPENVSDLLALANTRVGKDVTLDQAIDAVIKQYPQFTGTEVGIEVTTAAATNNDAANENEDAKARRIMGLPPIK